MVSKLRATPLVTALLILMVGVWAQNKAPLKLLQTIPVSGLKDGDFDHFAVDIQGPRLFLTSEDNSDTQAARKDILATRRGLDQKFSASGVFQAG
jgi:hypothetical protein